MNQENGSRILPEPLAKRRRGRPRKDENLPPKEKPPASYLKNIVIHQTEIKPIDDVNINNQLDEMVGQQVSGVIEGSFDSGFLLAVKTPEMDTVMRGVVFHPGRICSVTGVNDIAPLVKMHTRKIVTIESNQSEKNNKENPEIPIDFNGESVQVITDGENKNNFTLPNVESVNHVQNQNQFQDHVLQNPISPHGEKAQFGIGNSFITMMTTDGSFPAANPPFVLNQSGQSSCLGEQQTLETLFSPHLEQEQNRERSIEEVGVGVAVGEMVGSDHRQVIDGTEGEGKGIQGQESGEGNNGC